MSGKKVDYFVKGQEVPTPTGCILVSLEGASVPFHLRALLPYLSRSFWLSDEDFAGGYQLILAQMEAILSDCGASIVNNIIALRGLDPAAERDPITGVPLVSTPGSTLVDLFTTFQGPSATPGAALERIALATEATAQNTQEGLLSEDGVLLNLLLAAI